MIGGKMEDSLLVEGTWWKRIDDDAIGTILEIRDDNSNNLIVRWMHPSFEGSRAGEYDRYEFARKWVPLASHPDDVPVKVDSIWKSNKTGDIVKVLIEPSGGDHLVHYINLNDTTGHQMMSHVDKAVFITEHTFLRDNDNGALYRHNRNPNAYLKVIETTEKALMGAWMRFVKYSVIKDDSVEENDGCLIVTFHSCCHLLSLDPEKEGTVQKDGVGTVKVEEKEMTKIPYGSLWVDVKTGKDTFKVSFITSENGRVFVHYVDIVTGIERAEKLEEFVTEYKRLKDNDLSAIYERRDNPSEWVQIVICNPNSTCTSYHHYGGEFNGRDDENDITNFHKQYKLITFYPTDADIENMKLHGITKELKGVAKECDITVGSIWKEVRGCDPEDVGSLIKVIAIFGDIIKWTRIGCGAKERGTTGSTCRSSFLYCFEKVQDNDDGAIYRPFDRTQNSEENPGKYQMVKVVGTNASPTGGDFIYGKIKYVVVPVSADVYSMTLEEFHSEFELFSLNPTEEFCVDANDPNHSRTLTDPTHTTKPDDLNESYKLQTHVIIPGSIYFNCVGGIHIAIPFKEESGVVSFIMSDVLNDEVYFRSDVIEFIEKYTLYQVFNKPHNGEAFDELVNKTKERYDKMIRKDEPIMENSKETYLKTDTSKLEEFGSGAKREDKSGKGRYDLIPGEMMHEFELYTYKKYFAKDIFTRFSKYDVSLNAYFDEVDNIEKFFDLIASIIAVKYIPEHLQIGETVNEIFYTKACWASFHKGIICMRKALADHYEAGAKVHGVNNWKKGIPVSDSERGGNFVDSMRRHTDQYLDDKTDEPHAIAAIWNAFCAAWTIKNK
jgi:hypothetical protein